MNNSKRGLIAVIALALILIGVLTTGILKDRELSSINNKEYSQSLANSSLKKAQEDLEGDSKAEQKDEEKAAEAKPVAETNAQNLDFYGKLKGKEPVRVLMLGDGLAMSQGRTSNNGIWDQGIVNLIQSTYGSKVELKSLAQPGASTAVGADVVKGNDIKDYDLVITCFGQNDNNALVNASQVKANYNSILAEIKAKSPKATIIVVLPNTLELGNIYRDTIQNLAAENNAVCADMKKAFTGSGVKESSLMNGNLPNDKGYQVYTKVIGDVIKTGVK